MTPPAFLASPESGRLEPIPEDARLPVRRGLWFTALLLGAVWLPTLNQLRVEWSINAQYAYGWAVPLLALYLLAERWKTRPSPRPARSTAVLGFTAVALALGFLPLRVIQEAAPDWRLVGWAMAGVSLSLTLCVVAWTGGRPWLRHFLFPLCFILVAVPWPMPLERQLIQQLTSGVTSICVETLGWCAIPAQQQGNVIVISTGLVGVEEACSGVRSLQTTLMAALFLGELLGLSIVRRLALLVSGLALAFLCNAARSFSLVWLTAHHGPESVTRWHDSIGFAVLAVSLGGLAGLAALLNMGRPALAEAPAPPLVAAPRLLSRRAVILAVSWLLLVEVANEAWYRAHERTFEKGPSWSIAWPGDAPGFREVPLSETAQAMLRYSDGRSAAWSDEASREWSMIFIRWLPSRASAQLASSHGPELCLTAAGMQLREDLGLRPLRVRGFDLPIHAYLFSVRDRPLYVFYCLWENRPLGEGPASSLRSMSQAGRLRSIAAGQRNLGQQLLEVAVAGPEDLASAEAGLREMLEKAIR